VQEGNGDKYAGGLIRPGWRCAIPPGVGCMQGMRDTPVDPAFAVVQLP